VVPRLGITLGDPAGIGPEVLAASLSEFDFSSIPFIPIIIGRREAVQRAFSRFPKLVLTDLPDTADILDPSHIYLHPLEFDHPLPDHGKGSIESAKESLAYIDESIALWKSRTIDGIVTGPVNKGLIEKSGTKFMGHTEYIAERTGGHTPYMMMFSGKYRVLLVTTHYAIDELPALVNRKSILDTIECCDKALTAIDGKRPRIAVAARDPHCGDAGAISMFDTDVTAKAISDATALGIDCSGPFAADTLFLESKWRTFDCAIAQYHDQGLIPFKILAFEDGVNVTLGLPVVRTSVDHGTAYDIAGKGIAQHSSMTQALRLAARLCG
jgi:4-hydroxythreonine-4-phosphate dehydrogenase